MARTMPRNVVGSGLTVQAEKITWVVNHYEPTGGNAPCPCCMDTFGRVTEYTVEHTTWGEVQWASVCNQCGEAALARLGQPSLAIGKRRHKLPIPLAVRHRS